MAITRDILDTARDRIQPYIHQSPVLTCSYINELLGGELFFKCENFQKIGAFKIRGGMNAVLSLTEEERKKGIATHSSGNHAQAIALAARMVGTKAYIVMPENSPQVKINAVREYGAEVFLCAPTLDARESTLQEVVNRTGATFIHPFNDERVIAGQASCAKELLDEVPGLHNLIAPVGGGGLLSGTLLSAHYYSPETAVYAAEPEGAADAILSVQNGKIEKAPYVKTIADGLLTNLGSITFPIIQEHVKQVLTVSDEEIIRSMKLFYERMKLVVEPSGAVTLAAVLRHRNLFTGKRTGVIISGGNVDILQLSDWFRSVS
jgi:threonine dehydratase